MTTSRPDPADAGDGIKQDEAAALYRLMTWLSPSFPVGGFSYSSGIEWAVEACDITDAGSLKDWLAAMLADGSGFVTACSWRTRIAPWRLATMRRCATSRSSRLPSCRRVNGNSRRRRRAARSSRSRGRRGIATASIPRSSSARRNRLSRRGRSRQRRARNPASRHAACFPARAGIELDFGGLRLVPLGQTDCQRVLAALEPLVAETAARVVSWPRSMISAARLFAPTSPACGTRRNIRGYSGRDGRENLYQSVVRANAGSHNHWRSLLREPSAIRHY